MNYRVIKFNVSTTKYSGNSEPGCPEEIVKIYNGTALTSRSAAETLGAFFLLSSSPTIVTALPIKYFFYQTSP